MRPWKYRLIESMNPTWANLYHPATGEILAGPADVGRMDWETVRGQLAARTPSTNSNSSSFVIPAQAGTCPTIGKYRTLPRSRFVPYSHLGQVSAFRRDDEVLGFSM